MAKALLDVIRQTETEAQATLDAARAESGAMVEKAKSDAEAFVAESAVQDASKAHDAVTAAEAAVAANRAAVLADYERQAEALRASAGKRLPACLEMVVASVTGA